MKHLMLGLLLVLSAGCISMAAAEDVSGQWLFKLERDPTMRNDGAPVECTVRQRRAELTLRCGSSREEIPGELLDRKVVFRYEKPWKGIPPMTEDRLVVTYAGELNESGTNITGVFTVVSSVLDLKIKFKADKMPN
jgi:hypothetical protein